MKIRNGFVSNSSSASFIVHWRMRTYGGETNIKEALGRLYDACIYDQETGDFKWDGDWATKAFKEKFEWLMKETRQNDDGSFTTTAFTSMLNSFDDLGCNIQSLVFALIANSEFEIVDTRLESEGNY